MSARHPHHALPAVMGRRRVLQQLVALGLASVWPAAVSRAAQMDAPSGTTTGATTGATTDAITNATKRDVVVVTSYPDEVVSRFEAAFEQAYPQWRLRIVWHMPHDALPTLRQPGPEGVDVYWTPSPRNYAMLKQEGLLRRLDIDQSGLPGKIGNTLLNDPDGYFNATETAGYGFAVNDAYLRQRGLPAPADWADLAHAQYAGHLALPNPGRVGFAPVMADIVLQAYGWQPGWALWSAIAANAQLIERGATFVSDEVGSGRRGIAPSIDFFVAAAIAKGAPLSFIYPRHGGVNPGQVGILAAARNPEGARAFVTFLLSDAGQKILAHPDIRKLPVRPSVYAQLPAGYHHPFAAADAGQYGYNGDLAPGGLALLGAVWDAAIGRVHAELVELWPLARAATGERGEQARQLLAAAPLSEAEAGDAALQAVFNRRRDDAAAESQAKAREQQWTEASRQRLAQVRERLTVAS